MSNRVSFFIICLTACFFACSQGGKDQLVPGMVISNSVIFSPDTIRVPANWDAAQPILTIKGSGISIDFNGLVLIGSGAQNEPDQFLGTAIFVEEGEGVIILGARAHGFKIGLHATNVDQLQIVDCDFSYNYRQRLKSKWGAEDLDDWLSYHQNDNDEWLRYGAAVYLKQCDSATVSGLKVTGGQNGLMITGCNSGLFYNNDIRFNSGVGIGLYRSSNNRVMHNRLDWNVRGYSHGIYARGQDSAGILVYEQSKDNVFAYNSATHSGDGFFLWAGHSTMETGEGGCNGNIILANDFSHAPANGIEVTFSSNTIIRNKLEDCRYGIWGGYSYQTRIIGNVIAANDYGIAVEHGQANAIRQNIFAANGMSIQLFERKKQPEDWGFSQQRDIRSGDYFIEKNLFLDEGQAFDISSTTGLHLNLNTFWNIQRLANEALWKSTPEFRRNRLSGWQQLPKAYQPANDLLNEMPDTSAWDYGKLTLPVSPLPEGQAVYLPAEQLKGRSYILVDEWGPYDFQSPSIWLRTVSEGSYTFLLLGPEQGNWKAVGGEGWSRLSLTSGTFPATLVATKDPAQDSVGLDFEYIGASFVDRFGQEVPKGTVVRFAFSN